MPDFKREHRYIVFKLADFEAIEYFGSKLRSQVEGLAETVAWFRERNGKPPLECVIVESDWPEYEPTWEAIKKRMTEKPKCNCCERAGEYNGFGSDGPLLFHCDLPNGCSCHD